MTRRKARENAFIALFEFSFGGNMDDIIAFGQEESTDYALDAFGLGLIKQYMANADAINLAIESKLKGWKVERLPRVNLSILRLAVTEMRYGKPDMHSVVINEAVELAKKYADDADYQFVNGLLGNLSRETTSE